MTILGGAIGLIHSILENSTLPFMIGTSCTGRKPGKKDVAAFFLPGGSLNWLPVKQYKERNLI
jgi:hypothetical protein